MEDIETNEEEGAQRWYACFLTQEFKEKAVVCFTCFSIVYCCAFVLHGLSFGLFILFESHFPPEQRFTSTGKIIFIITLPFAPFFYLFGAVFVFFVCIFGVYGMMRDGNRCIC